MIKEKILSKEQVVAHIVGVYVSMCRHSPTAEESEKQEQLKIKLFKDVYRFGRTIPKRIITFSDLKNNGIFSGYSDKEKKHLFKETIMRAGFTTYSINNKEYYGIEI